MCQRYRQMMVKCFRVTVVTQFLNHSTKAMFIATCLISSFHNLYTCDFINIPKLSNLVSTCDNRSFVTHFLCYRNQLMLKSVKQSLWQECPDIPINQPLFYTKHNMQKGNDIWRTYWWQIAVAKKLWVGTSFCSADSRYIVDLWKV